MKNLKVSKKLLLSFSIVTILCITVGIVGYVGMWQINKAGNNMYQIQTKPLPNLAKTLEYIQRLRIQLRNAAIFSGDLERLKTVEADIIDREEKFEAYASAYGASIVAPKGHELYKEAMDAYENTFKPTLAAALEGAKEGREQQYFIELMDEAGPPTNLVVDNFTECMNIKVSAAETANKGNLNLFRKMLIFILIVLFIAVFVSIFFTLYISGLISKPLLILTALVNKAGLSGNITITPNEEKSIDYYSKYKDEVGQCVKSFASLLLHITNVERMLETVANGDLTAELSLLSDEDAMGLSLQRMNNNLNGMFDEINTATEQVSIGAKQIADGAQILAQGSTEQAAAVQQLSSSVNEIVQKTISNANMADKAAKLAGTIMHNAEKGSRQMDEMMQAVKEINQANQNIDKVIKAIDDIAFQTNILALNAAVEAARAGQQGKGFAVVAEEVRSLAAKSAEAAKDTGILIVNSIEKAKLGVRIADDTASSLEEIVTGIHESNKLVGEIARSSEEQSESLSELNKGINQVSQVVQQNSATAEESASSSQEMSSQAIILEGLIGRFKLKNQIR